jgi:hypothetical protein
MSFHKELHSHNENLWVLCAGKNYMDQPLSPLMDLVDWYNNKLVTKSLIAGKVSLELGEKLLVPTTGLLTAERLMIVGLGDTESLGPAQARKFLQDIGQALKDLGASDPWIIFAPDTSPKFLDEIKKSRTSIDNLGQATISVG